jgi:hypothetical protein
MLVVDDIIIDDVIICIIIYHNCFLLLCSFAINVKCIARCHHCLDPNICHEDYLITCGSNMNVIYLVSCA